MKKTTLKLADYRDRYRGLRAVIVGSGPTTYNYKDLEKISGPIGFINDATFVIPKHTADHFFFTHHQDIKRFWDTDAIYLRWIRMTKFRFLKIYFPRLIVAKPKNFLDVKFVHFGQDEPTFPAWSLDKDYIAKTGKLHVNRGSITGMIHFLWFCGIKEVLGIGINPATINQPHDSRIGIAQVDPKMAMIIRHQRAYFEHFGINVEYHS
jgi:hypothetical protein